MEALLPFNRKISTISTSDRRKFVNIELPFDPNNNFGPHCLAELKIDRNFSMDECYDFLDKFVYKIDMDPITRPYIIKDRVENPDYLSGIIIIAQSHISIHYDYKTQHAYFDIFSCAAFDYSKIEDFLSFKGSFTENNFVFYLLQSDHSGDQKTCSNCCDRHHHGVSQEVKEIKELHSDDLHTCQWSIAKG